MWGGECDEGKRQSPIDLNYDVAVKGKLQPFTFVNYAQPIERAIITNTGYSSEYLFVIFSYPLKGFVSNIFLPVQINNPDQGIAIAGGGLPGTFIMDQMHFHWSSEHTLEGERYALELHIVHHDSKYSSLEEAATYRNGIAVLGIIYHVEDKHNEELQKILDAAEAVKNSVGEKADLIATVSPFKLLPKDKIGFFRYEGSLTTPGDRLGLKIIKSI
jgi:carbonic anhydrase